MLYYNISFDNYHSQSWMAINVESGELAREQVLRSAKHSQLFEKGSMKTFIDTSINEIEAGKSLLDIFTPDRFLQYPDDDAPIIFFRRDGSRV